MKHFTFKWLKRLYILIAVKLVIVALLLTSARILFISVADYKQQAIDWLKTEYQVNIAVEDISAGIDFSGMVLIFNHVELLDSEELPFVVNFEYLFLHLDFWDSVTNQQLNFNRISLQGADITLHTPTTTSTSKESQLTIDKLQDIFLTQLKKVSVKDSTLNYTDKFGRDKVIIIEQLRWLNEGRKHQGIGQASFPKALGENSLKFVVDLFPQTRKKSLSGNIYLQADNLNVTDYLSGRVNSNAKLVEAVVGFDAWAKFSANRIDSVVVEFTNNQFSWSQLERNYNLALTGGTVQLTKHDNGWLLDSYDLAASLNNTALDSLSFSGKGDKTTGLIDFTGLSVKDVLPFYLLHSSLSAEQISALRKFDLDANIEQFGLSLTESNALQFSLKANQLKNRPVRGVPGISNARIALQGDLQAGRVDIELGKQKIYFDGQFSRSMPLKSGNLDLQWQQTKTGLKLFSEQALLTTDELDTNSEFSLFLPNEKAKNQSAFLSLYSYASVNDASKAQYYFPIKAMGKKVFAYLEPTIKKGHVTGAKILWYGAFNHYPYANNNGIFQAWVPVRDAQYDFYGNWEGLTDLDLDLLFENDYLLMDAKKATLGEVNVASLTGKVDHLKPDGTLTIKAAISEDAHKVSDYLKASPLKDSVGKALSTIEVSEPIAGNITLSIPFNRNRAKTKTEGSIVLKNNSVNIHLADDVALPLTKVNGSFDFVNGNLSAKNINASLFEQPIGLSFGAGPQQETYQIDAKLSGIWKLDELSHYHRMLAPLHVKGDLDWTGALNFTHKNSGGYNYSFALDSATHGVSSKLPMPLYKHALDSWPTTINVEGSDGNSRIKASIKDKLAFDGQLSYHDEHYTLPYFSLNIGQSEMTFLDKSKQVIDLKLNSLNLTDWYDHWLTEQNSEQETVVAVDADTHGFELLPLVALDEIKLDVKHLNVFNQPLSAVYATAVNLDGKWVNSISSDNLQMKLEYRTGTPVRFDIKAKKINLQELDVSLYKGKDPDAPIKRSENLLDDYPELFIECETCIYKDINLSPLSAHLYPTKKRLNIDYIKVGDESEFASVSGFWDQRLTNVIFDTEGNRQADFVKRLGYVSPVNFQKAQFSGAVNWVGAPWQVNLETLNGAISAELTAGAITEVSDKGTRLLSIFSLDGIHRSLNLEFDDVFAKGFNFDKMTFSGNINDGVSSSDDFYLTGSAGKITGSGLVDLPNQLTNYNFSYSPAVTSSLPVLAAFAINPLTGAAVLMISKLLEPVVDIIVRVDFNVKGDLKNPEVKLVTRERGKIKLGNSEVLQEMTELPNESLSDFDEEEFNDSDD